jgi:8-oxo-dGTP pyrophosphatase MutT (NUDIX family)
MTKITSTQTTDYERRIAELLATGFNPVELGSVAVIVTNSEGKFLLLQRSFDDLDGPGLWDIAGGTPDEKDMRKSAMRELEEETGLKAETLELVKEENFICPWKGEEKICLAFKYETDEEPFVSHEHETLKWVTAEEIEEHEFYKSTFKDILIEFATKEKEKN